MLGNTVELMPETGPPPLFDHVTLGVRDLSLSRAFYEEALRPFAVRVVQSSQGPLGFATDGRGDFWIKQGVRVAGPVHIAFAARDRVTVDAFHRAAVQAGGTDNGQPGLRPHYRVGYYAAYVLDPDGNNVEAVFNDELSGA
jgi:catechol 2,3-dioxygenase-like lactoylglutathione lyase family enzyme